MANLTIVAAVVGAVTGCLGFGLSVFQEFRHHIIQGPPNTCSRGG